jgi:hypothetical protein
MRKGTTVAARAVEKIGNRKPTNDDLDLSGHFLSPKFRLFWPKRSFSTATGETTLDRPTRGFKIYRDIPRARHCESVCNSRRALLITL